MVVPSFETTAPVMYWPGHDRLIVHDGFRHGVQSSFLDYATGAWLYSGLRALEDQVHSDRLEEHDL